jgi:hypothetical protein
MGAVGQAFHSASRVKAAHLLDRALRAAGQGLRLTAAEKGGGWTAPAGERRRRSGSIPAWPLPRHAANASVGSPASGRRIVSHPRCWRWPPRARLPPHRPGARAQQEHRGQHREPSAPARQRPTATLSVNPSPSYVVTPIKNSAAFLPHQALGTQAFSSSFPGISKEFLLDRGHCPAPMSSPPNARDP